jgi:hypothetical protein
MQFTDKLTFDGSIRRTTEGYAIVTPRVAKGGNVQLYMASELGDAFKDHAAPVVRVYRPEAEVFKKDAISSYAGVPVTVGHPDGGVSAANWKDHSVGEVGDEVIRDGEFVRVPMTIRDATSISKVEAGERELSMGYSASIVAADGVTPNGQAFDAVMSNFKMNHVAIVPGARGGSELRIGDAKPWGLTPITDQAERKESPMADLLRTIVLGDKAVSVAVADAETVEAFKKTFKDQEAKLIADHAVAMTAKDEEIGKLRVELKTAQDAAKVDVTKLVADRVALETQVKAIDSAIETTGKSDADLRKATVAAKLGDAMVADASADEISGMFKALASNIKADDSVRDVIRTQDRNAISANDGWGENAFSRAGVTMKKGA